MEHLSPIMGPPECVAWGIAFATHPEACSGTRRTGSQGLCSRSLPGLEPYEPRCPTHPGGYSPLTIQSERSFVFTVFLLQHIVYLLSKCCGPGTPLHIRVAGGLESCLTLVSGPGNRGRSACGPTHVARLEFPPETGLILKCAGKAGNPFQTTQGNRLSCRDQEGRRGSEEAVPGPSVFPSREPGRVRLCATP